MNKVTPEQLSCRAVIYVRQSTMGQVPDSPGSREWRYGLADRARALGWPEPEVIDGDFGRSGGGGGRPGFERLLGDVCRGEIGIILAVDATGLSRNGTEWHLLIDYCGLVGCLSADEQSVYDPRIPSDRLMPGVQGAVSELETSDIRRRMMEGKRRRAAQGRLFRSVPAGYVRVGKDRTGKDPDERVRSALELGGTVGAVLLRAPRRGVGGGGGAFPLPGRRPRVPDGRRGTGRMPRARPRHREGLVRNNKVPNRLTFGYSTDVRR